MFSTVSLAQSEHDHDNDCHPHHGHGPCLPITLTSFTAKAIHNAVKITWTTSSETNNDYFTLYRSPNGFEYLELVGTISGSGNSTMVNNYSYTDEYPSNGLNYYVLTQTDYNGERVQYDPIAVYFIKPPEMDIWDYYNFLGQEIK